MTPRQAFATATNALLAFGAATALTVSAATHDAPLIGSGKHQPAPLHGKPHNTPTWRPAYAAAHPGCVAAVPGEVTPQVLVVDQSGDLRVMDTGRAWARLAGMGGTETRADDVWIVGQCGGAA